MILLVIPKISTRGQTISFQPDGFQMGAAALFVYEKSKRLKLKAELYYNREFF